MTDFRYMLVAGLDPGASGGICIMSMSGSIIETMRMPATDKEVSGLIKHWAPALRIAYVELVHSMPQDGRISAFSFGRSYGALVMALVAHGVLHDFVMPLAWMSALKCRTGGNKNVTKEKAKELWPAHKWTHATADAALIAYWGVLRIREAQEQAAKRSGK